MYSNSSLDLLEQIQSWAKTLHDEGWISSSTFSQLNLTHKPSAADLFEGARPVVVAFFGGTGVGKSTLLNRLAGAKVAKTGIERPTSREVTFYLHASVKPEKLPPGLARDKIKLVFHQSARFKEIVWVDLPDIDSLEPANRELTFSLLSYCDILIYVVSPERYRDDLGFRVLMERRLSCAFLFVMNHWDEAQELQVEDFTHQLRDAGFSDPIVLRCDSRPDIMARSPDDFGKLVELLESFVRSHGLEQLLVRKEYEKLRQLEVNLTRLLQTLECDCDRLIMRWRAIWKETQEAIRPGLMGSAVTLAREVTALEQTKENSLRQALLWDSWTEAFLLDALDRLALEGERLGVPLESIQRTLAPFKAKLPKMLIDQVQLNIRRSLATPASWFRRFWLRCFGILRYLLPLAVSLWAGYQLVLGFYSKTYLGVDFAVHSLLLVGFAWGIPQFLYRLLQPSLEKAALRGIQRGLALGFESIALEVEQSLSVLKAKILQVHGEGKRLEEAIRAACNPTLSLEHEYSSWLNRMVATLT